MPVLKQTIVKYQAVYGSTKTNNSQIPGCITVLKQTIMKYQDAYGSTKTNNSEIPGCIWQY